MKFPMNPAESFAFQEWHWKTMPKVPKSLSFARLHVANDRIEIARRNQIAPCQKTCIDRVKENSVDRNTPQIPRTQNKILVID